MKRCIFIICLLLIGSTFVACGNERGNGVKLSAPFFDSTDDQGNHVVLKEKPKRIVSTSLGIDEVLIELTDESQIAALSWYAHDELMTCIAPRAKKYKHLQRNIEAIMSCHPDLVIVTNDSTQSPAFVQGLKDVGLTVFVSNNPEKIDDILNRIKCIGKLIGREDEAEALNKKLDEILKQVDEKVGKIPEDKKPVIIAFGYTGAFGKKGGLFDSMCERAGVKNGAAILGKVTGVPISKERVLLLNPDIIFLPTWEKEKNQASEFKESLLNDPAYQNVKAIREKRLLEISDKYRYSASQYAVFGVEVIARAVYPKLFK